MYREKWYTPYLRDHEVQMVLCQNYLNGFCVFGHRCRFQHPPPRRFSTAYRSPPSFGYVERWESFPQLFAAPPMSSLGFSPAFISSPVDGGFRQTQITRYTTVKHPQTGNYNSGHFFGDGDAASQVYLAYGIGEGNAGNYRTTETGHLPRLSSGSGRVASYVPVPSDPVFPSVDGRHTVPTAVGRSAFSSEDSHLVPRKMTAREEFHYKMKIIADGMKSKDALALATPVRSADSFFGGIATLNSNHPHEPTNPNPSELAPPGSSNSNEQLRRSNNVTEEAQMKESYQGHE